MRCKYNTESEIIFHFFKKAPKFFIIDPTLFPNISIIIIPSDNQSGKSNCLLESTLSTLELRFYQLS